MTSSSELAERVVLHDMPEHPIAAVGWRIVVKPVDPVTEVNGIALPKEAIQAQEYLRYIGQVVDVGPLAYSDERFSPRGTELKTLEHPSVLTNQAWCKAGDWIAFGRHAGQEVKSKDGIRYRILNDDDVLAIVDPDRIDIPVV